MALNGQEKLYSFKQYFQSHQNRILGMNNPKIRQQNHAQKYLTKLKGLRR